VGKLNLPAGELLGPFSSAGVIEHVRLEASLLEVAICGERLGQRVPLHDHEREAIR
jgi:hypothetical protein